MSILPKLINRFTRIPTKIPIDFIDIETPIVKFILKCKKHTKTWNGQNNNEKKKSWVSWHMDTSCLSRELNRLRKLVDF